MTVCSISRSVAMASITLTLNDNSSRLHAEYFPPIDLSDGEYVCGLVDFQTFNTIPNVDETNNLFHLDTVERDSESIMLGTNNIVKIKSEKDNTIVIPTGTYEVEDISKYLKKCLEKLGVKFELVANKNTLKCELMCSRPLNLTRPNSIGALLGFGGVRLEENTVHESDLPANILKVNVIRIECDLIKGSYINNIPAHTIHEFSPRVPPGYKINEVPNKVIYFPVTVRSVSSLNIGLVDQNGHLINFRGETITVRVHIKKVK